MADSPSSTDVALAFIEAINARDSGAMTALMTDDHTFIDSMGAAVRGMEPMRQAWIAYSVMVPDYRIVITETFSRGNIVALFGTAAGTFAPDGVLRDGNRWETPAAWRVVIDGGKVSLWQVYADNEPIRVIMERANH